jgi:hypothetical protein
MQLSKQSRDLIEKLIKLKKVKPEPQEEPPEEV